MYILNTILGLVASASLAKALPAVKSSLSPCDLLNLNCSIMAAPILATPNPPAVAAADPSSTAAPLNNNIFTVVPVSGSSSSYDVVGKFALNPRYCGSIGRQSYSGPASNHPRMGEWRSFDELFDCNTPSMRAVGDSNQSINDIYDAIQQVSGNTGVDNRVILSIIMQESHGKINTPNAGDGQNTPGLMQAMGCPNHAGEEDVSREDIFAMVQCGTDHFRNIDGGASSDEDDIYVALRSYNSGVNGVNRDDLSNCGRGTGSYVSDVASRLKGWVD